MGKIKRESNINESFENALKIIKDIEACVEDILAEPEGIEGAPISKICLEHGINYSNLRKLLSLTSFQNVYANKVIPSSDIELPEMDPYENLFRAVFRIDKSEPIELPVDIKESAKYAIDSCLNDRERIVINARFGLVETFCGNTTPMTLVEIADLLVRSKERIREIEQKALRKLRHPNRSGYLKYGLMQLNENERVKQVEFELAREETKKRTDEIIRKKKLEKAKPFIDISDTKAALQSIRLDELCLSSRAYNCLIRNRIFNMYKLIIMTDEELLNSHGMGEVTLHEVKNSLNIYLNALGITPDDVRFLLKESKSEKSESDKPEELPTKGFESEDGYKYDVRFRKIK